MSTVVSSSVEGKAIRRSASVDMSKMVGGR